MDAKTALKQAAKQVGIDYIGMQLRRDGAAFPLFNDPLTRTTFTMQPGESLEKALFRKRRQFLESKA
jgi:hypothetical protein